MQVNIRIKVATSILAALITACVPDKSHQKNTGVKHAEHQSSATAGLPIEALWAMDESGIEKAAGTKAIQAFVRGFQGNKVDGGAYAYALLAFIENPRELDNVVRGQLALSKSLVYDKVLKKLMRNDAINKLLQEKSLGVEAGSDNADSFKAILPSIEQLSKSTAGTLGQVWAEYMVRNKLDFSKFKAPPGKNTLAYYLFRLQMTHDIWHVVTGYETINDFDEIALQAFMLAQLDDPISSMVVGGSLIATSLHDPDVHCIYAEAVRDGMEIGRLAEPLLAVEWEKEWEKPVKLLRAELKLKTPMRVEDAQRNCTRL